MSYSKYKSPDNIFVSDRFKERIKDIKDLNWRGKIEFGDYLRTFELSNFVENSLNHTVLCLTNPKTDSNFLGQLELNLRRKQLVADVLKGKEIQMDEGKLVDLLVGITLLKALIIGEHSRAIGEDEALVEAYCQLELVTIAVELKFNLLNKEDLRDFRNIIYLSIDELQKNFSLLEVWLRDNDVPDSADHQAIVNSNIATLGKIRDYLDGKREMKLSQEEFTWLSSAVSYMKLIHPSVTMDPKDPEFRDMGLFADKTYNYDFLIVIMLLNLQKGQSIS